ncbi:MAG: hypothetical protein K5853_06280 [Lachnospiraceae bacterium]|nr:hypothetical protein [Lachnospiraceae bacterium]
MIDRFNSDKITQEKEFLDENYESAVKIAKADVPAEFEKLDFAFGLYGGGESVDTETFRERYGKHYFPELEGNETLMKEKVVEKNINANSIRADMGKLADKIVNSDMSELAEDILKGEGRIQQMLLMADTAPYKEMIGS